MLERCCDQGAKLRKKTPRMLPLRLWDPAKITLSLFFIPVGWSFVKSGVQQMWQMIETGQAIFLSVVGAVLFAIGCACAIDVLYSLALWVWNSLIGRRLYWYVDNYNGAHLHKELPECWQQSDGSMKRRVKGQNRYKATPRYGKNVYRAVGPVFQVREGGLFRKNKIMGYPWCDLWKIRECWDGETIIIEDHEGSVVGGAGMPNRMLLELVAQNVSVTTRWVVLEQLGKDAVSVIDKIQRESSTMGNSPHVRAIKRFLIESLEEVPKLLRQHWQQWADTSANLIDQNWERKIKVTQMPELELGKDEVKTGLGRHV